MCPSHFVKNKPKGRFRRKSKGKYENLQAKANSIFWILTLRDFLETQTNEENSEGVKIIERKRRWAKGGLPKRFWIYIY